MREYHKFAAPAAQQARMPWTVNPTSPFRAIRQEDMQLNELYFCVNCEAGMNLGKHLRCSVCGSDAVDLAVRPLATIFGMVSAYLDVEELEKLYAQ